MSFPDPPEGDSWHNPHDLSSTQVGIEDGWRLLTESEFQNGRMGQRGNVQYWFTYFSRASKWDVIGGFTEDTVETIRILVNEAQQCNPIEQAFDSSSFRHQDTDYDLFCKGWEACKKHYNIP